MQQRKACVLIPTYNNGGTLRDVVERVLPFCADVIVVNDGCTDHSAEVLASFGERITVVDYGRNRGKGYALKQGFKKAKSKGFDYALTLDSDGQHFPEDIPLFVNELENLLAKVFLPGMLSCFRLRLPTIKAPGCCSKASTNSGMSSGKCCPSLSMVRA